jgi:UDP-3-O-[3-hydroxymyristoyl] glucosamine N-acyltransferase
MQFTAAQIALIINGTIHGNDTATVTSFGKIEEATAGQLSFLSNPKYEEYIYTAAASIIIVNESLVLKQPVSSTLIKVKDAYAAFATLLTAYENVQSQQLVGIQQPSYIDATAVLHASVFVGAFAYIGQQVKLGEGTKIYQQAFIGNNVKIGTNCIIHPGVKIYHNCIIGNNVIIHAGTIIGSDGFGFAPLADGSYKKIPQIGNVVIENDVEIGSNCTIDRATMGSTLIKAGAKLDNLLQIAHNVEVGNHTVIAAQSGVSGSSKIGNKVLIGGQVGIVGHIQIADGSKINAQSGVSKSIKAPNTVVTGSPAYDYTAALRSQALARKLPELEKRLKEIEEIIHAIKK